MNTVSTDESVEEDFRVVYCRNKLGQFTKQNGATNLKADEFRLLGLGDQGSTVL